MGPAAWKRMGCFCREVGVSDERRTFWFYKCSAKNEAHLSAKALGDNIKSKKPWLECPLCNQGTEEVRVWGRVGLLAGPPRAPP